MYKYTPIPRKTIGAKEIKLALSRYMHTLDIPSYYFGHEMNTIDKEFDKDYEGKFLFCMPVEYGAGVNNMGVAILYDRLNKIPKDGITKEEALTDLSNKTKYLAERAYMPDKRLYTRFVKDGFPTIFSMESKKPVWDYDFVAFSSYFELQFLNIIHMLHTSSIPLYSKERIGVANEREIPFVFMGGVSAYSPEPIANNLDAVFVGDGEIQIEKVAAIVSRYKKGLIATKKEALLEMASTVEGVYLPWAYEWHYDNAKESLYARSYTVKDEYKGIVPEKVVKALVDLEEIDIHTNNILPCMDANLLGYTSFQISRGCPHSCRFCMASHVHKPYRELSYDKLMTKMKELPAILGSQNVVPYSFNFTSHAEKNKIAKAMTVELDKGVTTSTQRVDSFDRKLSKALADNGQRSCTIAVEAGSERMRNVINKEISNKDIFNTIYSCIANGLNKMKIYMIGNLPLEEEEDRQEIVTLMNYVKRFIKAEIDTLNLDDPWDMFQSIYWIYRIDNMRDPVKKQKVMQDMDMEVFELLKDILDNFDPKQDYEFYFKNEAFRKAIEHVLSIASKHKSSLSTVFKIKLSYTEFTAKPFTPLQYADVSDWSNKLARTFDGLIKNEVQFTSSISDNNHFILQLLNRVDRRFNDMLVDMVINLNMMYNARVIMDKKDIVQIFDEYVAKYLSPEVKVIDWFKEIPTEGFILPWEIISAGYSSEWLAEQYKHAKEAATIPSCFKKCSACGVCQNPVLKAQGAKIPTYIKDKEDIDTNTVIEAVGQKSANSAFYEKVVVLLKVAPEEFGDKTFAVRSIPSPKYKLMLKAAFAKAGIPVKDKMELVSEAAIFDNWASGYELAVLRTFKPVVRITQDQIDIINKHLEPVLKVETVKLYKRAAISGISQFFDYVWYNTRVYVSPGELDNYLLALNQDRHKITIIQKVRGDKQGRVNNQEMNIELYMVRAVKVADEVIEINFFADMTINPYSVLRTLMGYKSIRQALMYPITRVNMIKVNKTPSILEKTCECGEIVESDLFGTKLGSKCIACQLIDKQV